MPQRPRPAKPPEPLDGARFVRPRFARTPDDDLAFALGYPHVPAPGVAPLADAEAKQLLQQHAKSLVAPRLNTVVLELEAQVGAAVVATTLIEIYERFEAPDFHSWNRGVIQLTRWGGLAILRTPASVGAALRVRLEDVYDRAVAARTNGASRQVEEILDVVLHGAKGAERSGHRYQGAVQEFDLLHAHDDPEFVADQVKRQKFEPQWGAWARLAFLGGAPVVRHYTRHWRKIRDGVDVRRFVRDFGRIRSPAITKAIREIAATEGSPAADDAAAWLSQPSS